MDEWSATVDELRKTLPVELHDWLKETSLLDESDSKLRVGVPNILWARALIAIVAAHKHEWWQARSGAAARAGNAFVNRQIELIPEATALTAADVYEHRTRLGAERMTALRKQCAGRHAFADVTIPPLWLEKYYQLRHVNGVKYCSACYLVTIDPEESQGTEVRTWFLRYGCGFTSRHVSPVPFETSDGDISVKTVSGGLPDTSRRRH